ncbi:hypothetical protein K461DRAFT_295580 [Myriangium duriaei CBS 260.36]|uniref:Uncharacterized protein n=1 Tax=Myriangium duriaei CBS 260.36 TaxID=1168546 RepID=A0A9P4MDR6_9PEZI|nr:hypothetical protein K461DRAFT_295580 [Myriangium duriaei CBS 260.36]
MQFLTSLWLIIAAITTVVAAIPASGSSPISLKGSRSGTRSSSPKAAGERVPEHLELQRDSSFHLASNADKNFRTSTVFTTQLELSQPVEQVTDNQLVQIGIDAFKELQAAYPNKNGKPDRNMPHVITVLASGQSIYIASSVRGGYNYVKTQCAPPHPLGDAIQRLSDETGANAPTPEHPTLNHANYAACGEIMTMAMYFKKNGLASRTISGRILAVQLSRADGDIVMKRPCDPIQDKKKTGTFGCKANNPALGVTDIKMGTKPAPYTLAGIRARVVTSPSLC